MWEGARGEGQGGGEGGNLQEQNATLISCFRKCYARGSPEGWLTTFEETMKNTVRDLLKTGMNTFSKEAKQQWSLSNPGQVVLTVVNRDCRNGAKEIYQCPFTYEGLLGIAEVLPH